MLGRHFGGEVLFLSLSLLVGRYDGEILFSDMMMHRQYPRDGLSGIVMRELMKLWIASRLGPLSKIRFRMFSHVIINFVNSV